MQARHICSSHPTRELADRAEDAANSAMDVAKQATDVTKSEGEVAKLARDISTAAVMVDGKLVKAQDTIKLLGVCFDGKLSTTPHARDMLVAVKQRAAVISRLENPLPRWKYLRQLAVGDVNGKLGHTLAAFVSPRLPVATGGEVANATNIYHQIQVAYNRVARSITGYRLRDRVTVLELLEKAGVPSVNEMIVSSVAMKTWSAKHSSDGRNGAKNFVGALIFNQGRAVKPTRAATAGMAVVLLRGRDTFVSKGAKTWNLF
jgi:hypothetical protein